MRDFDNTRIRSDKEIIKRLIGYAKPFIPSFVLALMLIVVVVLLELVGPLIIKGVADILGDENPVFIAIIGLIVIYFIVLVVGAIISYFQTMILQRAGQRIIYNIREEVFTHIEYLSIGQINSLPVGKLVTRVTNDTNTLNEMYTSVIVNLIKNVLTIVGVMVFMFIINWRLTLLILTVVPFVAIFSFVFRRYSRKAYREVRNNVSNVNAFLAENLSGMKLTQIFNQEEKKHREFDERNQKLKKSYLREILIFGIYRPTMYLLYITATIIIYWYGGIQAMKGDIVTIGTLIAFTQYINKFFDPIQQLAEQFNILQSAFAASEKIFDILDTEPIITNEVDSIELEHVKGDIEFKNVWFAYEKDEWILRDVSFKVSAKETVAFVGATGAGKTTILALIVRNYDIQKGQILIDGIDIKHIKLSSLRRHIGQMLQDVFMFSGTIASNIRLRDPEITDEEILEAANYVNANAFIQKMPLGYEEKVKERGNNFSAGQRQLISFARTLVHKPSVMILDEATANIDTETEQLIQSSLYKMMNIGTMLIVAHRLSTIQHADKIIVMQKGEIKEQGNHQELLRSKGLYYNLYQLQYENKDGQ